MHGLMSGDWKRGTVSGPQRLQLDAWTAPDLTATAPAPDSTARQLRCAQSSTRCARCGPSGDTLTPLGLTIGADDRQAIILFSLGARAANVGVLGWHHRRVTPALSGGTDDAKPQRRHDTARPRLVVHLVH